MRQTSRTIGCWSWTTLLRVDSIPLSLSLSLSSHIRLSGVSDGNDDGFVFPTNSSTSYYCSKQPLQRGTKKLLPLRLFFMEMWSFKMAVAPYIFLKVKAKSTTATCLHVKMYHLKVTKNTWTDCFFLVKFYVAVFFYFILESTEDWRFLDQEESAHCSLLVNKDSICG